MPSVVQFSGGRTSAFMLRMLLDWHGGHLPSDWKVCFENTGKEREETLEFIHAIECRWRVPIVWLEYDDAFSMYDYADSDRRADGVRFRVVDFKSASRNGEPFERLLRRLKEYREAIKGLGPVLPNPVQRLCTAHLKLKVLRSYVLSLGWDDYRVNVGIRADEAHRLSQLRRWLLTGESVVAPLIQIGVTKPDVMEFWAEQPFDLQLDPNSDEGNCDLCFLKATGKLVRIIQKRPESAEWWKRMEVEYSGNFSQQKPTFRQLSDWVRTNDPKLQKYLKTDIDKTIDCFCGE